MLDPTTIRQCASYHSLEAHPAYAGNPLIEALPPIASEGVVTTHLRNHPPPPTTRQRALPVYERVHCVSDIDDLVVALPSAFDVECALSIMLRRGYAARNPFDLEWRRQHYRVKEIMSVPLAEYQFRSKTVPAMMVTGVSGSGKTTLVERLLEMYPQTISHTRYLDESFNVCQLVWIKVNASFDASLKGLVLSMFGAVDAALGTNYRQQYEKSKASIDTMIGNLSQVFATHHLGVLFVDEIQCLMLRGDDEAKLALSLFLKLGNVCRVPIIFGGTYAATRLFAKVARNARRVCSGGYFDLALPGSYGERVWDKLVVELVWKKYQWVDKPAPLTNPLRIHLHNLSQGILAVFIALHRASQVFAIRNNLATVDEKVLQNVYKTQFVLLHPALEALRSGKANRLERFEDLLPPKDQLNSLLRPTSEEALAERIQRLLISESSSENVGSDSERAAAANPRQAQPDQKISSEARNDGAAASAAEVLLEKIGANAELAQLARQVGLIR